MLDKFKKKLIELNESLKKEIEEMGGLRGEAKKISLPRDLVVWE